MLPSGAFFPLPPPTLSVFAISRAFFRKIAQVTLQLLPEFQRQSLPRASLIFPQPMAERIPSIQATPSASMPLTYPLLRLPVLPILRKALRFLSLWPSLTPILNSPGQVSAIYRRQANTGIFAGTDVLLLLTILARLQTT